MIATRPDAHHPEPPTGRRRTPTPLVRAAAAALLLAVPTGATPARAEGTRLGPPVLRAVPVLDPAKGREAEAAFLRVLRWVCRQRRIGARDRVRFGTPDDLLDPKPGKDGTCQPPLGAQPIASGALTRGGADEVLLTTAGPGQLAGPDDASTLALMRREHGAYRFVGMWLYFAGKLTARLRVTTGYDRRDHLVLCFAGGRQGVYPGECGFFDQGPFKRYGSVNWGTSGVPTGDAGGCGPKVSIAARKVELYGNLVRFSLLVRHYTRVARNVKDRGCSVEHAGRQETYTLDYRLAGGRFVATAPLPAAISRVVEDELSP